jgi:hypothetical protein
MTKTFVRRFIPVLLMGALLVSAPTASNAANQACGQPSSAGASPTTQDALAALRAAVGLPSSCSVKPCVCDVNNSGGITTGDALVILRKAVGQGVTLNCPPGCIGGDVNPIACTSAEFQSRTGSDLDSGWTGIAHNQDLILGAAITFDTMRRCSNDQSVCEVDADCGGGDCVPTCDCGADTTCEIQGPTHGKNCFNSLDDCTTNADCGGQPCIYAFGPPLPLSSGGVPVCVISIFDSPITGTANSATGEALTAANLKSRVFLGEDAAQPCPACGLPGDLPEIGQEFECVGGANDGDPCTVDGVSELFGGTSFDCPPNIGDNVSGAGLAIRFQEVTTGTSTRIAQLPCGNSSFKANPLTPGSNPKCIDNLAGPVCASNADCKRCTGDPTTSCTSNTQCTGKGTCSEAPDQPVTCGFWCNCGFCNNNPSLPCFQSSDCPSGQTCQAGSGTDTAQNAPQAKPNDCSLDKNICGMLEDERCGNTPQGECSEKPWLTCTQGSATCENNEGGECVITSRSCFEPRITRTGEPSPLGKYCAFEVKACTSNADCTGEDDFCAEDASRPETVALFCVPATTSPSINQVGGITGPGAVRLNGFVQICRCGDNEIGCDETCDDGNTVNGDSCNDRCKSE